MSLKEEQLSAIKAVYERQDVFVSLPTGYGKGLCYQTLPFLMEHILVVSPLVALIKQKVVSSVIDIDQVSALEKNTFKYRIADEICVKQVDVINGLLPASTCKVNHCSWLCKL